MVLIPSTPHAAADVTFSLLTSGFVFSPSLSLTWIQFVFYVQFVLRVWLLRQQRHASHDKYVLAISPLIVLQATKAGHRGLGTRLPTNNLEGCGTYKERVGSEAIPNKPFIYSGWLKIADTVQIWPHKSYGKSYQHPRFLTTAHASHVKR